jgi:undecaprenyl diphosphate synthase
MEDSIKNIAIIMDGNGRWANKRGRPRIWGHIRGASRISGVVEKASDMGLESLTLYAFSTENWSRPREEVFFLFKLLDRYLDKESKKIIKNKIRFKVIGDYSFLPEKTKAKIEELQEITRFFEGLKLDFAFGYGGRFEIINTVNRFIQTNPSQKITEKQFESFLLDPEISNIDLVIRTGGERRVSNFLLWQIAYAEIYFEKTPWPEFDGELFEYIITSCSKTQRRFGGLVKESNFEKNSFISNKNIEHVRSLEH